mgnify:FL=1
MILKEKERTVIQDLQTQEKSCIEKYGKYAQQARDPELKSLFQTLQKKRAGALRFPEPGAFRYSSTGKL